MDSGIYSEKSNGESEEVGCSMFEEIVGQSSELRSVLTYVIRVAPIDSTVLITGETGTGISVDAKGFHSKGNTQYGQPT
jgi:transcriptional regulator with GAF, ATPase, and Fis domain